MDCRLMDLDVGDMNEFMNGLKEWMLNILFFQKKIECKAIELNTHKLELQKKFLNSL